MKLINLKRSERESLGKIPVSLMEAVSTPLQDWRFWLGQLNRHLTPLLGTARLANVIILMGNNRFWENITALIATE